MMRNVALTMLILGVAIGSVAAPVHTTYIWHMEQPIYWPAASTWHAGYQTAWESIVLKDGGAPHPENDVRAIFSVADRVAAYQYRPRDAIQAMTGADAGAQVTYTGGLIRNVASLGAAGQLGYTSNWNQPFITGRGWNTSGGRPRLEMTIIPYHHALAPLVDRAVLKKEIQIYQHVYPQVWGSTPPASVGFFPPELASSERIIPVLAECGIGWCFVPSNHLSRACSNFPLVLGTGGENCDPPNRADQINPSSDHWFSMTISRGCTPTDAVPFSFQLHWAEQVDPQTGTPARVIVVPVAMAMSWQDGYQVYGVGDVNTIAPWNDPARPMLVALGHDGDNAFGGGYSYYMESVPGFTSQAVAQGYEPTTVPEYLADHPVPTSDLAHVEDGAWINADGDFGSPDFINWNWPPYNASGQFDIPNGWALDIRNWAVITAATNRVVTAEAAAGGSSIAAIQNPTTTSPAAIDLAWHFLLGSLNSGYMYYGSALDMEMKPTVACNIATDWADQVLPGAGDPIPPTIWILQQHPHNPGGIGFGSLWGYQQTVQPREFYVWTFIYDVSGVSSATFYYRLDADGMNPLSSTQNETFAGGGEVSTWRSREMNRRAFPAGNVYNDPSIVFGEMPDYIAEQFTYYVNDAEIVDSGGVLVDYYVEAMDSLGNIARSDIYHTYVDSGSGGSPGNRVWWTPEEPEGGENVTIYYDAEAGPLPSGTNPVYIHIGHSGWQGILNPDPQMTYDTGEEAWRYTYSIPLTATAVDFVFQDGLGHWDNNNGADWHIPTTPGGSGFVMDGSRDGASVVVAEAGGITLWAGWDGRELYVATSRVQGTAYDQFIFVASPPGAMRPAPWAKSGQVATWAAYLAEEGSNGYNAWYDTQGSAVKAAGSVLEGAVDLTGELGTVPGEVWLCCGRYQTADGGILAAQAPAAVAPGGHIEASEWVRLVLQPDSLTISVVGPTTIELRWSAVVGATEYAVFRADSLSGSFVEVGRVSSLSFQDSPASASGKYQVRACY